MGYYVINTALGNTNRESVQHTHRRRRKTLVIDETYIRFELGLGTPPTLTPEYADRLESELRLRQVLHSKDVIHAIVHDPVVDTIKVMLSNPDLPEVEIGAYPPKEDVRL